MKNNKKIYIGSVIVIIIIVCIIGSLVSKGEVFRNYKIKNMDVNTTLQDNGDLVVEETREYRFNGIYNGITLKIPKDLKKEQYTKYENSINDTKLLDSLYNNTDLNNFKVYLKKSDGSLEEFKLAKEAKNGDSNVFLESYNSGYENYKIYSPARDENKVFVIQYTLKNVAVKHLDVSELYWNFIGGGLESKIDNLNINIKIPQNKNLNSPIKAYIHGPINKGKIKKITDSEVWVNYKNIKPYQYVATRVVLDNKNLINSSKESGLDAIDTINLSETKLEKLSNDRRFFNNIIIFITFAIFVYWILLLLKFEKEKNYKVCFDNYDELLDQYNPVIAACIVQNRDMHPRDIIATLVNLANKKVIIIEDMKLIYKDIESTTYKLKKNPIFFKDEKNLNNLDEIEISILDIFFEQNTNEIILEERLEKIEKNLRLTNKIKALDKKVTEKLYSIGANSFKVPKALTKFNTIVFVFLCILIFINIIFNVNLDNSTLLGNSNLVRIEKPGIIKTIFLISLLFFPLWLFIINIVIRVIYFLIKQIEKVAFKFSVKKIFQVTIVLGSIFSILYFISVVFIKTDYITFNLCLFSIGLLLILTDNLMSNHSTRILKNYFGLKMLEDDIINGSMLKNKEIKDNVIWGKYLTFAIAIGVSDISEYSKKIDFNSLINITGFLSVAYFCTNNFYSLYNVDRHYQTAFMLDKFSDSIGSLSESWASSLGGSSFGGDGGSSFGDGGFSGGGGGGRPEEELFKIGIKNKIIKK